MKKIELKKFGVGSLFKVTMYMLIIPVALLLIVGLVMILIGIAIQDFELVGIGIFVGIGYPVIFVLMYALFGAIMAWIYNWLAGKFGGLEFTINELDENKQSQVKAENVQ